MFIQAKIQSPSRYVNLLGISGHILRPRALPDQITDLRITPGPLAAEDSGVDVSSDLAAEGGVEDLALLAVQLLRREQEQGHGAFKVGEEFGFGGGHGREVRAGEADGREDLRAHLLSRRAGGQADQFDELETEEREVEGVVVVKELWGESGLAFGMDGVG